MSQTDSAAAAPGAVFAVAAPYELAATLAARLCHDFISPASAIVSGLDLLDDPTAKDMRDDAMGLINTSARKLVDLLSFARVAFGVAAGAEAFDSAELERLAKGVYAHARPELDWAIEPQTVEKAPARALLNLAQLAATALPLGGVARIELSRPRGGTRISILARGPKARLHAEVAAGVAGQPLGEGLSGRWVQAYYLYALMSAAGGRLAARSEEGFVHFQAALPA